jgi:hypothetical protein
MNCGNIYSYNSFQKSWKEFGSVRTEFSRDRIKSSSLISRNITKENETTI